MFPGTLAGVQYLTAHVPAAVANAATAKVAALVAPFKCRIVSAEFVPLEDVTGADTDSRNLNLKLTDTDGTEIANLDFADGTDAAALAAKALTMKGTEAQQTLAAGEVIALESELVGTNGLALPAGVLRVGVTGR
jgi:hypothetical protein